MRTVKDAWAGCGRPECDREYDSEGEAGAGVCFGVGGTIRSGSGGGE